LIINKCFRYIEDSSLPAITKVRIHSLNPEAFSLQQPSLRRIEPEKRTRREVIGEGGIVLADKYEVSVTPNGGFVELRWADFFMTDGSHNSGGRHRLWAQLSRDGCAEAPADSVVGDCFNITGEYPLTMPTSGCILEGQAPEECPTLPHPIVSNSTDPNEDGWVDTDTYHPIGAQSIEDVTQDPIWQGKHNICNNAETCSIAGFKGGDDLPPYFAGREADKFILEVDSVGPIGGTQALISEPQGSSIPCKKIIRIEDSGISPASCDALCAGVNGTLIPDGCVSASVGSFIPNTTRTAFCVQEYESECSTATTLELFPFTGPNCGNDLHRNAEIIRRDGGMGEGCDRLCTSVGSTLIPDGCVTIPHFMGPSSYVAFCQRGGSPEPRSCSLQTSDDLASEPYTGTILHAIAWEYWNYDIDHEGKIEFTAVNNSIMGETYALLKATDSIGGQDGAATEPIPFNWTVTADGFDEWTVQDTGILEEVELATSKIIGVAADPEADPRTGSYNYSPGLLLEEPSQFVGDPEFDRLVSDLAATEVFVNSLTFRVTLPEFTPPQNGQDGEGAEDPLGSLFLYFYSGDTWYFVAGGDELATALRDSGGVYTETFADPVDVKAYAFVHDDEVPDTLIIESFEQELYYSDEYLNLGAQSGFGEIPAGESMQDGMFFNIPEADPNQFTRIVFTVSTDTPDVSVYFKGTGSFQTEDPNDEIVAVTSTRVVERVVRDEYFHIRLEGQEQVDCFAYSGAYGATGEANKPRIKFDWGWDKINPNTCSEENPDYIYCDATQFTISLLYRLDRIREIAESGLSEENLNRINDLKLFDAYLIEDGITEDFRADLNRFLLTETFLFDPQETLLAQDHPWQYYLTDYSKLQFNQTALDAGLYEVYISFSFEPGTEDYTFFHITGDPPVVELVANITVTFNKWSDPPVDNPFYRLPIDGTIGKEPDGSYDRHGYGLRFDTSQGTITLVGEPGDALYVATDADSGGIREVQTVTLDSFDYANSNKGELFSITKTADVMVLSPSIATPVLLEMNSANSRADAFYYLSTTDGSILSSPSGFMNLWTGAGSTMGERPANCQTFDGSKLPYRQRDYLATGDGCVLAATPSYGFPYPSAPNNQKMFLETVFFIPNSMDVVLHDSCADSSAKFYSPDQPAGVSQLGLSNRDRYSVASVQDVIDLIGQGYVCVSEDAQKMYFWWNPQKLTAELDPVKQGIPQWANMECTVSQTPQ